MYTLTYYIFYMQPKMIPLGLSVAYIGRKVGHLWSACKLLFWADETHFNSVIHQKNPYAPSVINL